MIPRRLVFVLLALILSFAAPALSARAEDEPVPDEDSKPAPKPARKPAKNKAAKKKPYDYERSKYKSREPPPTSAYKFNDKGEPISADTKKKAKKKKRSEPPEVGTREGAAGCSLEDNCADRKTEADAL